MESVLNTAAAIAARSGVPSGGKPAVKALADYQARAEAIALNADLNNAARARHLEAESSKLANTLSDLAAADERDAVREIDRAEGELRASLRLPEPALGAFPSDSDRLLAAVVRGQARAERRAEADALIGLLVDATDPAEIIDAAADVAAWDTPALTSRAYVQAVARLRALHADAKENQRPPIFAALMQAEDVLKRHRAAHPGVTRRLRQLANQRGVVSLTVGGFYGHIRQLAKLDQPTTLGVEIGGVRR